MMAVPLKEQRPRGTDLIYHALTQLLVGQQPIRMNRFGYADGRMWLWLGSLHRMSPSPLSPGLARPQSNFQKDQRNLLCCVFEQHTGHMPYLATRLFPSKVEGATAVIFYENHPQTRDRSFAPRDSFLRFGPGSRSAKSTFRTSGSR